MSLITAEAAYDHLRLGSEPFDADDIALKVAEAEDIVLDWVTTEGKGDWDEDTCPPLVQAAVKLVLKHLYDERDGNPLTDGVKNVLRRHRDPPLA